MPVGDRSASDSFGSFAGCGPLRSRFFGATLFHRAFFFSDKIPVEMAAVLLLLYTDSALRSGGGAQQEGISSPSPLFPCDSPRSRPARPSVYTTCAFDPAELWTAKVPVRLSARSPTAKHVPSSERLAECAEGCLWRQRGILRCIEHSRLRV